MPAKPAILGQRKNAEGFARQTRKEFYQSMPWRRFRKEQKLRAGRMDAKRVHELYAADPRMSHDEFMAYITRGAGEPLCVLCIEQGRLVIANTLDHITPIIEGGAELDASNVQWLCPVCHNTKSIKEHHGRY